MAINRRAFLVASAGAIAIAGCGASHSELSPDERVVNDALARLHLVQESAFAHPDLAHHLVSHVDALYEYTSTPRPETSSLTKTDLTDVQLADLLRQTSDALSAETLNVSSAPLSRTLALISSSVVVHAVSLENVL